MASQYIIYTGHTKSVSHLYSMCHLYTISNTPVQTTPSLQPCPNRTTYLQSCLLFLKGHILLNVCDPNTHFFITSDLRYICNSLDTSYFTLSLFLSSISVPPHRLTVSDCNMDDGMQIHLNCCHLQVYCGLIVSQSLLY